MNFQEEKKRTTSLYPNPILLRQHILLRSIAVVFMKKNHPPSHVLLGIKHIRDILEFVHVFCLRSLASSGELINVAIVMPSFCAPKRVKQYPFWVSARFLVRYVSSSLQKLSWQMSSLTSIFEDDCPYISELMLPQALWATCSSLAWIAVLQTKRLIVGPLITLMTRYLRTRRPISELEAPALSSSSYGRDDRASSTRGSMLLSSLFSDMEDRTLHADIIDHHHKYC